MQCVYAAGFWKKKKPDREMTLYVKPFLKTPLLCTRSGDGKIFLGRSHTPCDDETTDQISYYSTAIPLCTEGR